MREKKGKNKKVSKVSKVYEKTFLEKQNEKKLFKTMKKSEK